MGLTQEDALLQHNLASLSTRRDVALLGVVHRTVLGLGPPHFRKWFFPAAQRTCSSRTRSSSSQHPHQLHDYLDGTHSELLKRSPLGLTRVYNQLPAEVVAASTVSRFQRQLQEQVKSALRGGRDDWELLLSPRRVGYGQERHD